MITIIIRIKIKITKTIKTARIVKKIIIKYLKKNK